ncbi:MAG TPA: FlgD immunoglobulin-like domain containing protein [Azospirillaceae bacterium]|nr:FlgD immunoglobulin-like domain containing protein [Azospirillaceae bacterium]
MSTSALNNASNPALSGVGTTSKEQSAKALSSLADNYETFLSMLTAQLRNQDPLQPQDSAEFTNQLVQFAQVEQQIKTNSELKEIKETVRQSPATQALSYVGKYVELESDWVPKATGDTVVRYNLSEGVQSAAMVVTDGEGKEVAKYPISNQAGERTFRWDGKDRAGKDMPAGLYRFNVAIAAKEGASNVSGSVSSQYSPYGGDAVNVRYDLGDSIEEPVMVVRDSGGSVVRKLPITGALGPQTATWDGKNNAGQTMAQGYYDISIVSDVTGRPPANLRMSVLQKVTGVDMSNGQSLMIGDTPVPMSRVSRLIDG